MRKHFTEESARAAAIAAGAEPLDLYPGNMASKWRCKCSTCGAIVYPRMLSISRGSKACRYCFGSNKVPIEVSREAKRQKELETRKAKKKLVMDATTAVLAAGAEPLESFPGRNIGWRVRCLSCGRESKPTYANLAKGQGACFRCGTDYGDKPANVYLFHDPIRHIVKVGITNERAHRLTKYSGWQLLYLVSTNTGKEAARLEALILRTWRIDFNLPPKISREEMPLGGYTETADDVGLIAALNILKEYSNKLSEH